MYPRTKLIALERLLIAQASEKKRAKWAHRTAENILSPINIARKLALPQPFVRRYAWERRLDSFDGNARSNDIWLGAYAVAYMGWSCRDASKELGFSMKSIENFMYKTGWKRYVLWGNARKKKLVIPRPFGAERWKLLRKLPGYETTGNLDWNRFAYFTKKHK